MDSLDINPLWPDPFLNKTILVTGGTGSFGQAFVKIALSEHDPKVIRVYSRGELLQKEMQDHYGTDSPKLRFLIGDVRDNQRLLRALDGVDIVVHAAALKQVPISEYNPVECIRTNIFGSMNLIEACIDRHVQKVIGISSDKAVMPVNLYGSTKQVMEKLFTQANVYSQYTRFACTRYGNVIGSRGSVIPLFLKQKAEGVLKITHPDMTRFWLTVDQGVRFVIQSIKEMTGGEVFVPRLPSMNILQLAKAIAPNADVAYIGIRPGEKIHETLITMPESLHCLQYYDHYVIEPEFPYWRDVQWEYDELRNLKPFEYDSNNNEWKLGCEDLMTMIDNLRIEHEINQNS